MGVSQNYGYRLRVPIMRTIVFWGVCWGPPILENYHIRCEAQHPVVRRIANAGNQMQLEPVRHMALFRCAHESRVVELVLQVIFSPSFQQHPHNLHLVQVNCTHESCQALIVADVRVSTSFQQHPHNLH